MNFKIISVQERSDTCTTIILYKDLEGKYETKILDGLWLDFFNQLNQ